MCAHKWHFAFKKLLPGQEGEWETNSGNWGEIFRDPWLPKTRVLVEGARGHRWT